MFQFQHCGVYRCLQQCRVLPYLGKSFHKGFVAGGLLHVVVELHPHQQTRTDAQRRFEQHGGVRRERTAAVQDVVQHFVGYARLCGKLRLRQVAAFDFLLKHIADCHDRFCHNLLYRELNAVLVIYPDGGNCAECRYIFHKGSSRQFAGNPIAFTSTFG